MPTKAHQEKEPQVWLEPVGAFYLLTTHIKHVDDISQQRRLWLEKQPLKTVLLSFWRILKSTEETTGAQH
jgi:hypothetical protein